MFNRCVDLLPKGWLGSINVYNFVKLLDNFLNGRSVGRFRVLFNFNTLIAFLHT
jgi:hypothetical protein